MVVAKLKAPQEALSEISAGAALGTNLAKTKFAELTLLEAGEVKDTHVAEANSLLEALKAHKESCSIRHSRSARLWFELLIPLVRQSSSKRKVEKKSHCVSACRQD